MVAIKSKLTLSVSKEVLKMPYAEECESPFWVQPITLLKASLAPSIVCSSNAINAFVRGMLIIMGTCAIFTIVYNTNMFVFGFVLITALYGPSLYTTIGAPWSNEGFQADLVRSSAPVQASPQEPPKPEQAKETTPNPKNPFMNVLINELKYNPSRPPATNIDDPTVKTQLDDFFRIQWFSDPTDVFGRSQSQRQFYTMPSTSVPSDRGTFQDWLYKIPGKTCKEGGREACLTGTDGSPIPWLNSDR